MGNLRGQQEFNVGDFVFAKVKGYSPWPAVITAINGKKYNVLFYGTKETASVFLKELYTLKAITKANVDKYKSKRGFSVALDEMIGEVKKAGKDLSFWDIGPSKENKENTSDKRELDVTASETEENEAKKARTSKSESIGSGDITLSYREILRAHVDDWVYFAAVKDPESRRYNLILNESESNATNTTKLVMDYVKSDAPQPLIVGQEKNGKLFGVFIVTEKNASITEVEIAEKLCASQKIRDDICKTDDKSAPCAVFGAEFWHALTTLQRYMLYKHFLVEHERKRDEWLNVEVKYVKLEVDIKKSLLMHEANAPKALAYMKQLLEMKIEPLMLTKHPHVMDTVKRLRNYTGNVKDWNLTDAQIEEFKLLAADIRETANDIYLKFKQIYGFESDEKFSEYYTDKVNQFASETASLHESERMAICADPDSSQFTHDTYKGKFYNELIKLHAQVKDLLKKAAADKLAATE